MGSLFTLFHVSHIRGVFLIYPILSNTVASSCSSRLGLQSSAILSAMGPVGLHKIVSYPFPLSNPYLDNWLLIIGFLYEDCELTGDFLGIFPGFGK